MPKPASPPIVIATDPTVATGPDAGLPTRNTATAAALAAQGALRGTPLVARIANAWIGSVADWADYLSWSGGQQGLANVHVVETDASGRALIASVESAEVLAEAATVARNTGTDRGHILLGGPGGDPSFGNQSEGQIYWSTGDRAPLRIIEAGPQIRHVLSSTEAPASIMRAGPASVISTTSNAYVTPSGASVGVECVAGDVLRVHAWIEVSFSGGTGADLQLLIEGTSYKARAPANTTQVSGSTVGHSPAPVYFAATHIVAATGVVTVAIQWRRNTSGSGTNYTNNFGIRVQRGDVT
jgi:hypothetical protein